MQVYKNYTPEVSIILPTYNRKNLLTRAITSVINQTYDKWELIVVDDGSTDNSLEIIDPYLTRYDNIRYMRHSNRRPPLTLNAGILAAAGKYLTFIGSDDEYKPEHLELRMKLLSENPDIDLIHGGVEIVGAPFVKDKNDLNRLIHIKECVVGCTFVGKKKMFLELNGFRNLKYSDDSDFYERAAGRYKILKVDYPTYIYYRDTPDSICSTIE